MGVCGQALLKLHQQEQGKDTLLHLVEWIPWSGADIATTSRNGADVGLEHVLRCGCEDRRRPDAMTVVAEHEWCL
jgi:hypothetical protein